MDRSLVERAQRGDREAFTSLAFELSDRLFGVAHRILRDFDAAGDALQVALLQIWRDLPSLRDPALVDSWAHRVLVRACHDELRKQRRRAPVLRLLVEQRTQEDPGIAIADREQLDRAFQRLSADQRIAVVLRYYRGLTLTEIAEVLAVPVGTVRSRLHYAKRALRAAVESDARETRPRGRLA
jgi:RNA polymerase sigma-70 factor (ECF subfamily)